MREILFRGKMIKNNEWIEGCLIWTLEKDRYFVREQDFGVDFEVMPETVGQFTGLLDKNGKKIFEGDIVSMDYAPTYTKHNRVIEWRGAAFYTFRNAPSPVTFELLPLRIGNDSDAEIIGNIHDNPELIK